MASFYALLKDSLVELSWTTLSETDNRLFEVQKSANGLDFSRMELVKGSGNSHNPVQYHCIDHHPAKGINYYRLKQIDYDGRYHYSRIVSVNVLEGQANHRTQPHCC